MLPAPPPFPLPPKQLLPLFLLPTPASCPQGLLMAWLGSSQMGEAERLAVPPSVLMDRESHPQLCCSQVRLCSSGPCCFLLQPTLSARFHSCMHPFIYSVIYSTGTPQYLLGDH